MGKHSIMAGACLAMGAFASSRGIPLPARAGQRPYDYKPQSNREKKASEKAAKKRSRSATDSSPAAVAAVKGST